MDIHYRFVASGHSEVEKAFAGIETRARASKKATEDAVRAGRSVGATGRAGGGGAGPRLTEQERLGQRVAASQERAAAREVKAAERLAAAKAKAEERAAAGRVRAEERARRHVAGIRDKFFADEQRKGEKADREHAARVEKEANKRQRKIEEAAKRERAAKDRASRESGSARKQSIGVLKDLAGGAFLATVGTGAAIIGSAAKEALSLQEAASRISINSRKSGEGFRSPDELRRSFERTAIATPGQTAAGIADAVGKFVSLTGDVDTALKSQGTFATVASATGSNIGDIAQAAASLSQQFDIKGIDEMREALAALTFQGKEGSFELKDAAAQFQELAAAGAAFGIPKGAQGVKVLGGLTQIARSGTGSAAEASTAVNMFLNQLTAKQDKLRRAGVEVFDKQGKARDVRDLIVESISKVGGSDMAKKKAGLLDIFDVRGVRTINPLVAKYNTAFQSTQGNEAAKTAAGVKALRDEIERSINAPGDWADVQEDAAKAQQDSSAQIAAAWESVKAKTADSLLPSITKMAELLAGKESLLDPFIEAVELATDAVVWFADATGFKKKKTKAEVLEEAQRKADRAEQKAFAAGPMTPDKFAEVYGARDAAYDDLWGTPGAAPMTLDSAVDAYLRANPETATPEAMAANRDAVTSLLNREGGSNDWFLKTIGGENQAQQDIRHQFQGQAQGDRTAAEIDTKTAQDALVSFASTVTAVNAKLLAAGGGQGSIVTGV